MSDMDSITNLLMTKPLIGLRTQAYVKLAKLCVEEGISDRAALSILYRADNKWGKFKNRRDREERLQGILNYAKGRL